MRRAGAICFILACCATTSFAHYNMLFPDKPWSKKGEKVTFLYQFGHPFEHELFDAPKPVGLVVILPSGKKETLDLEKSLAKIEVAASEGKKVTAWRFDYTPAERGDHVFVLKAPPIKIDDSGHLVEDLVKVVLHVQTQNGWDTQTRAFEDSGIDIRPHTRPYGILPGMVFKGKIVRLPPIQAEPGTLNYLKFLHVEAEKYNEKPMKILPPEELITFQTKADKDGYFLTTLPEAGWWGITARATSNDKEDAKAPVHVSRRATLWIHVDEKK